MTKPLDLKQGDRVTTGGGNTGTVIEVRKKDGAILADHDLKTIVSEGSYWVEDECCECCGASKGHEEHWREEFIREPEWYDRACLRKLPDRKEGY